MTPPSYAVVVPTTGRESLLRLLSALESANGPAPEQIMVVDDRPRPDPPLRLASRRAPLHVLSGGGRGPAAARNTGWRAVEAEWVVFLDDDVLPGPNWAAELIDDLVPLADDAAASQARISVPLPHHRRPTDAERGTARLAGAWWITADMAYRRRALVHVGGFDEGFPRAYREDADLALRMDNAGYRLIVGRRVTTHPIRPADFLASVRVQAGNADNALMRRRHGRSWRQRIGEGPGRLGLHSLTTASAAASIGFALAAARRPVLARAAAASGALWALLTALFALQRIVPGPRTPAEVARMAVTSIAIPPVACAHRLAGERRSRGAPSAMPLRAGQPSQSQVAWTLPAAVLFDRDGTLIHDVAYNADPAAVRPVRGARAALDRLREHGVPIGVVSNQSGVARGFISPDELAVVNARVQELLGPFQTWQMCMHAEHDGCDCRKPLPGLVRSAASCLGVPAPSCVVIGDTAADVGAATAAGARAIMVPNERTLPAEVRDAWRNAEVAAALPHAVEMALGGGRT